MNWVFKKFDELSTIELYDILKLRSEIFVVEQKCFYQDLDDKDKFCYHLFLEDADEIIAALRIIPENVSYSEMAIGRVVVKKSYRNQGIATKMMQKAIDLIINHFNKNKIKLSGQAHLIDFYIKLGFKKVSNSYMDAGIKHYEFLNQI